MKRIILITLTLCSSFAADAQTSPNGKVRAEYEMGKGIVISYKAKDVWQEVMSMPTTCTSQLKGNTVKVDYEMLVGKKSHCTNAYSEGMYSKDPDAPIYVRVYNDGVAWSGQHDYKVNFSTSKNNWIPKWSEAYEEYFPQNRELTVGNRYAYPALFEYSDGVFALLSESNMMSNMAATSMYADGNMTFDLRPDGKENGGYQTLIIGSLADVVESTLITDNSEPCAISNNVEDNKSSVNSNFKTKELQNLSWIQPGVAAWVYWAYNHGSNDYNIIKRYTDMAIALKLPYVLIDAEWDNFLPPYKVEDAIKYATDNGIKPIIWYSSSIGWIDGAPGPKFRLNKPQDREREFAWLESLGVRGVKIDFFSGDTNQNIKFMIELLESAARHHLLVNFHGATIPRGWQRTYPNLISTEGVYGEEWYNNVGTFTDKAARHNATLPFTRNVVGSMDYTPCAFTDSQHPHITTKAHELALTALYESGIQHLADRPESFLAQPDPVKEYLSELPTAWDETRLLGGYPGDYVIMARRKGSTWYIAGINGKDESQKVSFSLNRLSSLGKFCTVFEDGDKSYIAWKVSKLRTIPTTFTLKPRGGFVIVVK